MITFPTTVRSHETRAEPETVRGAVGEEVQIPTFPLSKILDVTSALPFHFER